MAVSFRQAGLCALLATALSPGCGGDAARAPAPIEPALPAAREVAPGATDPLIADDDLHVARIAADGARAARLLVFLPGTGGAPIHYTLLLETAARQGYHALGLAYVNDRSVALQICPSTGDPDCPERVRLEILDGMDRTPLVDVDRANSIENRLIKLLQYLAASYPAEDWGAFLDADGAPRWERMTFAGHSQGAGHAAMVGKVRVVHRVALFSGTEPADWTTQPLATPPERYYGLVHALEERRAAIASSWENLGLPGTITDIDGITPPYGSHRLQTRVAPAGTDPWGGPNYHGAVVGDRATPLDAAGTPLLRAAWAAMIGP